MDSGNERDQRHRPSQIPPRQAGGTEAPDRARDAHHPDQGQRREAIVFERYRNADAALEHFANIAHLTAPLMETATVTRELLDTPNAEMRRNLTGDQPKLFEPWLAMHDESAAAD